MNGQVGATVQKGSLNVLYKQPLPSDFRQGRLEKAIAFRR
jgi:hypothetical protein